MGVGAAKVIRAAGARLRRAPSAVEQRFVEAPITTVALAAGLLLFGLVVVLQLASLPAPLVVYEGHHWRQAFTYGVAWNYAHETLDVLRPRMFVELTRSNVVPMEAPLYPLLAGLLFRVGGDSVVWPRLLSWLGLAATVGVLWSWLDDPKGSGRAHAERAGLLFALALAPIVAVDFRTIQPEPVAAGLAIASAFFLARRGAAGEGAEDGGGATRSDVVKGAVLFGLSLLAKPLALGVLPSLVVFAAWGERRFVRRGAFAAGCLVIATLPWLAWDRWAHHLLATELGGDWIIEIGHPPKELLRTLLADGEAREVFLRHLANFATSWWLAPAIVAGVHRGLVERRWHRYSVPLLVWMVGYAIELLAVGARLHSNAYYFILATAPLAFFAALGLGALVRVLDASQKAVPRSVFLVGIACALLLPLGSVASRPSPWKNVIEIAALGYERNQDVWTSGVGLARLLLCWIAIFAIAPRFAGRRMPRWLGVPIAVVIAGLVVRPMGDTYQYFRFHLGDGKRAGFDAELAALRSAVDRHSHPADRILLSPGGTYREPPMVFLYYAQRNGFPLRGDVKPEDVATMRARGARLYLRIDQNGPSKHPRIPGPLLAKGEWWQLSCIATDGCPARDSEARSPAREPSAN